jgi:adenylate cyclase
MARLLPFARDWARKLAGGIAASLLLVVLVAYGQLEPLENWSLARLFDFRGVREPTAPIVIVTIDESTMTEVNLQWPFPRAMHAKVIQAIAAGKPLAIGVDLIFDTPSSRGAKDDEALGAAVAHAGNVILGAAPAVDEQPLYTREVLNPPIPVIREGAAGFAPLNVRQDSDGAIRRVPLRVRVGDTWLPALDVEMHRLITQAGVATAPLPKQPSVLINFRGGPQTFPWVAYYRVLNGEVPSSVFRDKIVLVGPTSEIFHDSFVTAFAPAGDMPGVEIHANALDMLVRGDPIREVPSNVSTAMAVVAALLGAWLVVRLHALRALLAVVLLWAALTAAALYAFALGDIWMRGMAGTAALVLGYGLTVVDNFIREQREKRRLSQFFSPDVLTHVVRGKDGVSLGSRRRLVTVLFSDIRGFTSISEKLEPEQVAEMLQEYLSEMTEVVFQHGGTVDKYIGDCIMALYNVPFADPEHAVNAVRTGLAFQERTLAVSAKWEAKLGVTIRNGVGINTGEAVVGTLGSRQRLEYTAIGDTINLGSRLESITKDYGASIIISEDTYELVRGRFLIRELGAVTVKGKTQPVKIYAVLPEDLRQYPRATLASAATLSATDGEQECVVTAHDIGEGGIAVKGLPEEWPKGKMIQIRCEGGGLSKTITADGSIIWRRDDAAGIQFTPLDPGAASTVTEYVQARRT